MKDAFSSYLKSRTLFISEKILKNCAPAETIVARISYHRRSDEKEGRIPNDQVYSEGIFARSEFLQLLLESRTRVSVLTGESGLGKTWLLGTLFCLCADKYSLSESQLVPFLVLLTGEELNYESERIENLKQKYLKKGKSCQEVEEIIKDMREAGFTASVTAGEALLAFLFKETGLSASDLKETNTLILLDGVNGMPREGKERLYKGLIELFDKYPQWKWLLSTQPQTIEEVEWLREKRPLYNDKGERISGGDWEFFRAQPVTDARVEDYLRVHLGDDAYSILKEPLNAYIKGVDVSIRRNPRYLSLICSEVKKGHGISILPKELGKLFDEVISGMLREGTHPDLIDPQKVILGAIGIYEVLSEEKRLQWDPQPFCSLTTVNQWLCGFVDAQVLPKAALPSCLNALRSSGPWGCAPEGAIAFDHDTTRDYAIAYLIKYLLEDWRPYGQYEGFREWLIMELAINPKFSKSVKMVVDLVMDEEILSLEEGSLSLIFGEYISPFLPQLRTLLLQGLKAKETWKRRAVTTHLKPAVDMPMVNEALIRALDDMDGDVRGAAINALSAAVGSPTVRNALLKRLGDEEGTNREAAVRSLAFIADDSRIRNGLIGALKDKDVRVRIGAIESLSMVVDDPEVTIALFEKAGDRDQCFGDQSGNRSVSESVAKALAQIAQRPKVHHVLLKMLESEDLDICITAAKALAPIVPKEPDLKKTLMGRLADEDNWVRNIAAIALAYVAADPGVTTPLLKMLRDKPIGGRIYALESLKTIAAHPEVKKALIERLKDESEWIQHKAIEALAPVVNDNEVKNALIERLDAKDCIVRMLASEKLGLVAADCEVTAALQIRLKDKDKMVRSAAAQSLGSVAHQPEVMKALMKKLKDKEEMVRSAAAQSLSAVAHQDEVMKALMKSLNDSYFACADAYEALSFMAPLYLLFDGGSEAAIGLSIPFYLTPDTFVSVLCTVPTIEPDGGDYQNLNSGPRHTSRRDDKSQFIIDLMRLFPCEVRSIPALCLNGKSVFFNYATFCVASLLPDVKRRKLQHEPAVLNSLAEIFESHVVASMGFPASRIGELCRKGELFVDEKSVLEKTIFAHWETYSFHLSNLITNARNHAKTRCTVFVTPPFNSVKDPIVLVVDDGPGLPPEVDGLKGLQDKKKIEKIFERGVTFSGGTGNGLTKDMVREFSEMGFTVIIKDREGRWYYWKKTSKGDFGLEASNGPPPPLRRKEGEGNAVDMDRMVDQLRGGTGAGIGIMQE